METATAFETVFGAAQSAIRKAWEQCLKAIHACDRESVAARFNDFEVRFRRHIKLEEEVLFPALRSEAKLETDPTILMRAEHRRIETMLDQLHARVNAGDCAALYGQHVGVSALFRDHLSAEENVLYPVFDFLISREKRAEIISLAQTFQSEV